MSRRRRTGLLEGSGTLVRVARAYVALGSNLGDRARTLRDALAALDAEDGVEVAAVSTLIETDPVGYLDQPRFLNGVAALETTLPAGALLAVLLEVERRFGRVREGVPAQGPRTLDLDLLLYGDAEIDEPGLRVPHPRLHERMFVLAPLAELEPGLEIPGRGPLEALLAELH
jgi:2-amino-4-hydroxy-6-hydroxymethyldihydropteridine diphosphokinase